MPDFVKACSASDVPPGKAKQVSVNGKQIAVFNVQGKFYAIDNACAHAGGPLAEGALNDKVVTCPWHAMKYDVTTGAAAPGAWGPRYKQTAYETKVENENVMVKV